MSSFTHSSSAISRNQRSIPLMQVIGFCRADHEQGIFPASDTCTTHAKLGCAQQTLLPLIIQLKLYQPTLDRLVLASQ